MSISNSYYGLVVFDMLRQAPKPLTQENALMIGMNLLQEPQKSQFKSWFEKHGKILINKINNELQ